MKDFREGGKGKVVGIPGGVYHNFWENVNFQKAEYRYSQQGRILSFLIRYFSNYYTLHRSDLAARAAPLDPRLVNERHEWREGGIISY